jgi:hypothetical protein
MTANVNGQTTAPSTETENQLQNFGRQGQMNKGGRDMCPRGTMADLGFLWCRCLGLSCLVVWTPRVPPLGSWGLTLHSVLPHGIIFGCPTQYTHNCVLMWLST